jgi:SAM-dependent methyltransferase
MFFQGVQQLYDELSSEYHLLFPDWRESVRWQGQALDKLIKREIGDSRKTLLDCSCGIGTQAIGLALRGYQVRGTDVSPAAIKRARREAKSFGISASFGVADLLILDRQIGGSYDIVICCDNTLPHFLYDDELLIVLRNIFKRLKPGGLFISSIRDYDAIINDRPKFTTPREFDDKYGRRIVFQAWEWLEGKHNYFFHLFILKEKQGIWTVSQYSTEYRTLLRSELSEALKSTGFSNTAWQMPSESGYYQPIVVAHKNY